MKTKWVLVSVSLIFIVILSQISRGNFLNRSFDLSLKPKNITEIRNVTSLPDDPLENAPGNTVVYNKSGFSPKEVNTNLGYLRVTNLSGIDLHLVPALYPNSALYPKLKEYSVLPGESYDYMLPDFFSKKLIYYNANNEFHVVTIYNSAIIQELEKDEKVTEDEENITE